MQQPRGVAAELPHLRTDRFLFVLFVGRVTAVHRRLSSHPAVTPTNKAPASAAAGLRAIASAANFSARSTYSFPETEAVAAVEPERGGCGSYSRKRLIMIVCLRLTLRRRAT